MSKKKHSKLNKLLKERQLQQLASGQTLAQIEPTVRSEPTVTRVSEPKTNTVIEPSSNDSHIGREILRTLISLMIVAVLLVAAVIVDRHTHYLTNFGAWLFKALRLNTK